MRPDGCGVPQSVVTPALMWGRGLKWGGWGLYAGGSRMARSRLAALLGTYVEGFAMYRRTRSETAKT